MFAKILKFFSLVQLFSLGYVCLVSSVQEGCFRAAVYEHVQVISDDSQQKVQLNLDVYENVTITAANDGSDIIVFPEYGIFFHVNTREDASKYVEEIPDPITGNYNPCETDEYRNTHPILYRLSCLAKNNNIYIAADMGDSVPCDSNTDNKCPSDNHYYYNTAVLFDKSGKLIAKYHKMNLFGEDYFNIPPVPEEVAVNTTIGRLGLQVCFDLIFKVPGIDLIEQNRIDTMLFPTWWFDELPFLSAAQYQEAWAVTNDINLLSSNIHMPGVGSMGSGIFEGNKGALAYTNTPDGEPKLLISDIPISTKSNINCNPNTRKIHLKSPKQTKSPKDTTYVNKVMNMKNTEHVLLETQTSSQQINKCRDGVCCQLNYTLTAKQFKTGNTYYLIIANRTREDSAGYYWTEEFCALVRCDLDTNNVCSAYTIDSLSDSFKSVSISADFSTKYVYPSVVSNDIELVDRKDWTFTITETSGGSRAVLTIDNLNKPLLTFGFYGRPYDRDPLTDSGAHSLLKTCSFANLIIYISVVLWVLRIQF